MLSISAFNALLKSLEEPPPNTVFILATTEIHKIPETVISRCQRHDFRALSVSTIEARLREVLLQEGIEAEPEAVRLVARMADGSMRDAQTLLDRVTSFCSGKITAQDTSAALGSIERRVLGELAKAILQRDCKAVFQVVSDIFSTGTDPSTVLKEFVAYWRELFVARLAGEPGLKALGLSAEEQTEQIRAIASVDPVDMQDLWDLARDGADRALRASQPRYAFEALAVRLATRLPVVELAELVAASSAGGRGSGSSSGGNSGGGSRAPAPKSSPVTSSASGASVVRGTDTQTVNCEGAARSASFSASSSAAPTGATSAGLDWGSFLAFITGEASRILIENLKRVRITRFAAGQLEGTGPDLSVTMVMREQAKLSEFLSKFATSKGVASQSPWRIVLTKGAGALEVETQARPVKDSKDIEGHPAIQSLQKIFPGSKVEQVRAK
jgi:DNA polymerase-3 subunit gamma/tau